METFSGSFSHTPRQSSATCAGRTRSGECRRQAPTMPPKSGMWERDPIAHVGARLHAFVGILRLSPPMLNLDEKAPRPALPRPPRPPSKSALPTPPQRATPPLPTPAQSPKSARRGSSGKERNANGGRPPRERSRALRDDERIGTATEGRGTRCEPRTAPDHRRPQAAQADTGPKTGRHPLEDSIASEAAQPAEARATCVDPDRRTTAAPAPNDVDVDRRAIRVAGSGVSAPCNVRSARARRLMGRDTSVPRDLRRATAESLRARRNARDRGACKACVGCSAEGVCRAERSASLDSGSGSAEPGPNECDATAGAIATPACDDRCAFRGAAARRRYRVASRSHRLDSAMATEALTRPGLHRTRDRQSRHRLFHRAPSSANPRHAACGNEPATDRWFARTNAGRRTSRIGVLAEPSRHHEHAFEANQGGERRDFRIVSARRRADIFGNEVPLERRIERSAHRSRRCASQCYLRPGYFRRGHLDPGAHGPGARARGCLTTRSDHARRRHAHGAAARRRLRRKVQRRTRSATSKAPRSHLQARRRSERRGRGCRHVCELGPRLVGECADAAIRGNLHGSLHRARCEAGDDRAVQRRPAHGNEDIPPAVSRARQPSQR